MGVKGKVSVIIPSYNYGKFLEECLRSVTAQTYGNWEAVIVDDGSTDHTKDIAPQVAALSFDRIKYYRTENRGVTAARNFAIDHSDGEFILPLDADDLLNPTAIEDFVGAISRGGEYGFAYSALENFNILPGESSIWMPGISTHRSLSRDNPAACTSLWRRSLVERGVRYREAIFEDWDLWLQIAALGYKSIYVPKPLFRYRIHPYGRHTQNKNRYLQAWIQEIANNPALFSDSLKEWAQNGLKNAPQCFNIPSIIFLPSAGSFSFAAGIGPLRLIAEEFLNRNHFVVVIGGPDTVNDNIPGAVFLRIEDLTNLRMFEEHVFKMGREAIVFSEHSKELSLRLQKLNNVTTVISLNPEFDPNADFNLKAAGGIYEIDKRGMPVIPKRRDLTLSELVDQTVGLHAAKSEFKRGLEYNFYDRLIRLSQYSPEELREATPLVERQRSFSIVIPVGAADCICLKGTLSSLKRVSQNQAVEVVVVADGSAIEKVPQLSELVEEYGAKLIRYSFSDLWSRARACNMGVRASSNNLLVFLEPDVIVTPSFFELLNLYSYEMNKSCIFTCLGRILSLKRPYIEELDANFDFAKLESDSMLSSRPSFMCLALDRDLFVSLGGFNEGHFNFGLEREELIHRARFRESRVVGLPDNSLLQQQRVRAISMNAFEKSKELLREAERDPLKLPHWVSKTTGYTFGTPEEQTRKSQVLHLLARVKELESMFERGDVDWSKKIEMFYQWCETLLDEKEIFAALEGYQTILSHKPFHSGALIGLATSYLLVGDIQKAGHYARASQDVAPSDGRVLQLMKHIEEKIS